MKGEKILRKRNVSSHRLWWCIDCILSSVFKEREIEKFEIEEENYLLLRCGTDGEGMPFEAGDGRDFDKDPVARGKVEIVRPFDDQIGHFGG